MLVMQLLSQSKDPHDSFNSAGIHVELLVQLKMMILTLSCDRGHGHLQNQPGKNTVLPQAITAIAASARDRPLLPAMSLELA